MTAREFPISTRLSIENALRVVCVLWASFMILSRLPFPGTIGLLPIDRSLTTSISWGCALAVLSLSVLQKSRFRVPSAVLLAVSALVVLVSIAHGTFSATYSVVLEYVYLGVWILFFIPFILFGTMLDKNERLSKFFTGQVEANFGAEVLDRVPAWLKNWPSTLSLVVLVGSLLFKYGNQFSDFFVPALVAIGGQLACIFFAKLLPVNSTWMGLRIIIASAFIVITSLAAGLLMSAHVALLADEFLSLRLGLNTAFIVFAIVMILASWQFRNASFPLAGAVIALIWCLGIERMSPTFSVSFAAALIFLAGIARLLRRDPESKALLYNSIEGAVSAMRVVAPITVFMILSSFVFELLLST